MCTGSNLDAGHLKMGPFSPGVFEFCVLLNSGITASDTSLVPLNSSHIQAKTPNFPGPSATPVL